MAAVMTVNAAFSIEERQDDFAYGTQLANHKTEVMRTLNKTGYDFQRASVAVSIVSGLDTQTAFVAWKRFSRLSPQRALMEMLLSAEKPFRL